MTSKMAACLSRLQLAMMLGLLLSLALAASAQALNVTNPGGFDFPNRTLVLSVPSTTVLAPQRVHVTENGQMVNPLSVTSLKQANQGDFGVVVVIDTDPSMTGAPLNHAFAAARTLAAERSGNQELGVIFGNQTTVPLTSNSTTLSHALSHVPAIVSHTNLLAATEAAVNELKAGGVADGAVIFVSDDIDRDPTYTPQSVANYARAAGMRIYAVGIHDPAFSRPSPQDLPPQTMARLARAAGGSFSEARPDQLKRIFMQIEGGLTSQYIVRYRSAQRRGARVTMSVRVDGVSGVFTSTYTSPSLLTASAPRSSTPPAHHQSFWGSTLALISVALGCALLIGFAGLMLSKNLASAGTLSDRVGEFVPARASAIPDLAPVAQVGFAEELLARRSWWPRFVEDVDISKMGRPPIELAYAAALVSCFAAGLMIVVIGSPFAGLIGLIVGPVVVRALVTARVRRQRTLFLDQLPPHLEEVAGAIRSGRSLVEALNLVGASADEPLRSEFDSALADERLGLPIEDTLRPIAGRMQADGMEQLAVVTALQRRTGSSVAEVLEQIAEGVRERTDLQRELRALTAQGRLARWILTAMPPVMLIAFTLINKDYEHPLFHTPGGIAALIIGTLMVVTGSFVMKRIVEIEV